jgi:hypothetical protein
MHTTRLLLCAVLDCSCRVDAKKMAGLLASISYMFSREPRGMDCGGRTRKSPRRDSDPYITWSGEQLALFIAWHKSGSDEQLALFIPWHRGGYRHRATKVVVLGVVWKLPSDCSVSRESWSGTVLPRNTYLIYIDSSQPEIISTRNNPKRTSHLCLDPGAKV